MNKGYLSWGILGQASIAQKQVAPAIHQSRFGTLTALATRSPDKAGWWEDHFPGITVHPSYDALLGDPEIEAIYIPLPNHLHVEWTQRALKAGKHVLCEKPMALNSGDIDGLIRLRDETGCLAAEAFMVLHHPQWQRVRDIIGSGEIGELAHIEGAFTYNNSADPANIRNRKETGGGALRDIGVYPAVTARWVTGQEPHTLHSRISWENGVDVTADVQARFPGPALSFYCSMRMGRRQEMIFHGSEGFIALSAPFNPGIYESAVVTVRQDGGAIRREGFHGINQYQLQIEAFNRSVLRGDPYPCPLEFSRGNQRMLDTIYRVADLPEVPEEAENH